MYTLKTILFKLILCKLLCHGTIYMSQKSILQDFRLPKIYAKKGPKNARWSAYCQLYHDGLITTLTRLYCINYIAEKKVMTVKIL